MQQAQHNAAPQKPPGPPSGGHATSPAHDTYHPSLRDVQPSIFLTCHSTPSARSPSVAPPPSSPSACSRGTSTLPPQQQMSGDEGASASLGAAGLPMCMAALGPSVEHLLQHAKRSTELSPAAALVGASAASSALAHSFHSHPSSSQLKGLANGLEHTEQGVTAGSTACCGGNPQQQKAVQWQATSGAAGLGSGAKQACSSGMNSCIPAFHHNDAMASGCCSPLHERSASPLGCPACLDDSLPVLMPTLHSAFSPHYTSPMHGSAPHPELRDTSSCGAMQDVAATADDEEEHEGVYEAESSPARLVADSPCSCSDDLDAFTLRRVCSLIPQRGAMLTPCLLYTSPSPRDRTRSRMPSSA